MRCWSAMLALFGLFAAASSALAKPLLPEQTPEPLKPWTNWVLHGHENRSCPHVQGNPDERHCAWPTSLELVLDDRAGRFTSNARVYSESWLPLPGDGKHWPQQVEVDGKPAVLASAENSPGIRLAPGEHTVKGRFVWGREVKPISLFTKYRSNLNSPKLVGARFSGDPG